MPSLLVVYVMLALSELFFAGLAVIFQLYQDSSDPLVFSVLRCIGATPVFYLGAACFEGLKRPRLIDVQLFLLLGTLGIAINQYCFIIGLKYTSVNAAIIFQQLTPIFACLLALVTFAEPFNYDRLYWWGKPVGVLVAAGGATLMVLVGNAGGSAKNALFGYIMLIVQNFAMASFVVVQRLLIFIPDSRYHAYWGQSPLNVMAGASFAGIFCLLVVAVPRAYLYPDTLVLKTNVWIPLAYACVVANAFGYGFINVAAKYLDASIVTASWSLEVFFGAALAYLVFAQVPTVPQYGGAAAIIAGLVLVVLASYFERRRQQAEDDEEEIDEDGPTASAPLLSNNMEVPEGGAFVDSYVNSSGRTDGSDSSSWLESWRAEEGEEDSLLLVHEQEGATAREGGWRGSNTVSDEEASSKTVHTIMKRGSPLRDWALEAGVVGHGGGSSTALVPASGGSGVGREEGRRGSLSSRPRSSSRGSDGGGSASGGERKRGVSESGGGSRALPLGPPPVVNSQGTSRLLLPPISDEPWVVEWVVSK